MSGLWIALVILAVLLTAAPALLETGLLAAEREGTRVVVADFDYSDSSGEIADQRAEHAVRVKAFAGLLRNRLADEGKYKVLHLDCTKATCSAREYRHGRSRRCCAECRRATPDLRRNP